MTTLLIGSNNPSKCQRIRDLLEGIPIRCVSPSDIGVMLDPTENDRTAEGNAREKAMAWHRISGLPVLTEDSGLVLLDLPLDHPDQPGVHVRRAAGHDMSDDEMIRWYADIAHRHGGRLRAAWKDAWCLLADSQNMLTYSDDRNHPVGWVFFLVDKPCEARHPGWPLDSLSVGLEDGMYKAEMTIQAMDASFTDDAVHGKEERERFRNWLRQSILSLVLKEEG